MKSMEQAFVEQILYLRVCTSADSKDDWGVEYRKKA
jgi:hypothetical protein